MGGRQLCVTKTEPTQQITGTAPSMEPTMERVRSYSWPPRSVRPEAVVESLEITRRRLSELHGMAESPSVSHGTATVADEGSRPPSTAEEYERTDNSHGDASMLDFRSTPRHSNNEDNIVIGPGPRSHEYEPSG